MHPILTVSSALTLLAASAASSAQPVQDARADIRSTYDFEPSQMSFAEQAKRAPSLSALWDRARKNPSTYLDALRIELLADGNRELLYCDGGMLLLKSSRKPDDEELGLASIRKCSLAEIQHTPYFYTLHSLAVRGRDVLDLQFRMLDKPNYSVFVVQHSLKLGQDYAFLYPLLVRDEATYVPALIARLQAEKESTAQRSLVYALLYAATPESEKAIRTFADSADGSPAVRQDARQWLGRMEEARQWPSTHATLKRIVEELELPPEVTEDELRKKRRARMRSISDEALYELEAYTTLIYRARR